MKFLTKILSYLVVLYLTFCLQGCSTMSHEEQNVRNFNVPGAGKSGIYLYRVSKFVGSGLDINIVFDKKKVVELESGSFIYIPTVPGSHTFIGTFYDKIHALVTGEDNRTYPLRIKTEENTNYYIEFVHRDGTFVVRTKEEALGEIKECDYLPLIK